MDYLQVPVSTEDAERIGEREYVRIIPDALYNSLEVAIFLGYGGTEKSRRSAVSAIPNDELVRTPTGPRGGRIHYQGRDIIAYIEGRRDARAAG